MENQKAKNIELEMETDDLMGDVMFRSVSKRNFGANEISMLPCRSLGLGLILDMDWSKQMGNGIELEAYRSIEG